MELFAYFPERLKATQDGDGTLLDHSTILYGAALSDGNRHSNHIPPLLVSGHAGWQRGGRHVGAKALAPAANLFVNMLYRVGVAAGFERLISLGSRFRKAVRDRPLRWSDWERWVGSQSRGNMSELPA